MDRGYGQMIKKYMALLKAQYMPTKLFQRFTHTHSFLISHGDIQSTPLVLTRLQGPLTPITPKTF